MYNRYIRNDQGVYTRIPEEESAGQTPPSHRPEMPPTGGRETAPPPGGGSDPPPQSGPPPRQDPPPRGEDGGDSLSGTLRRLLDQLHLGDLDTGDLLLLAILYLLFREGADDEVLAALGLLLIL